MALSPLSVRNTASPRNAVSPGGKSKDVAHQVLAWLRPILANYGPHGADVKNFGTSWADGKCFYALVHHFGGDLPPISGVTFAKDKAKAHILAALKAGNDIGVPSPFAGNEIDNIIYGNVKDQLKAKIVDYAAKFQSKLAAAAASRPQQILSPSKEVEAPVTRVIDFEAVEASNALTEANAALQETIETQRKEIESLTAEVDKLHFDSAKSKAEFEHELTALKQQIDDAKAAQKDANSSTSELSTELQKSRQMINSLKNEIEDLKRKEKTLVADKEELTKEAAVIKMKLGRLNTELTDSKNKEKELVSEKESMEKTYRKEKDEMTKEIGALKTKNSQLSNELSEAKTNFKELSAEKDSLEKSHHKEKDDLIKENGVLKAKTSLLTTELTETKATIKEMTGEKDSIEKTHRKETKEKEELVKEIGSLKAKTSQLTSDLSEAKATVKELTSEKDSLEKSHRKEKDELTKEAATLKAKNGQLSEELTKAQAREKELLSHKDHKRKETVKNERVTIDSDILITLNKQMERNEMLARELDETKREVDFLRPNVDLVRRLEEEKAKLLDSLKASEEKTAQASSDLGTSRILLGVAGATIAGLVAAVVLRKSSD